MTELVRTSLNTPARYDFDSDQIATIRRTVAKDCTDPEFQMFMEVVARYKLDPFVKQIYATHMPGMDGGGKVLTIIVGRDGFLAIANSYDDFEGMEGDVVREGDLLERTAEGVIHTYPATSAEERLGKRIVGAWSLVHRTNRRSAYFFAPMEDYNEPRKRAWKKYPGAMILKVAQVNALRHAFSISGIYEDAEMGALTVATEEADNPVEIPYGEDELGVWLKLLFERANDVHSNAFRPQKIRVTLASATTDAARQRIADDLAKFIVRKGGELPELPQPEADPPEAEVVE